MLIVRDLCWAELLAIIGESANWSKLVNAALQVDGGQIAAKISQLGSSSNLGEQIHQAVVHARLMAISKALD